jgi:hypothetical protein
LNKHFTAQAAETKCCWAEQTKKNQLDRRKQNETQQQPKVTIFQNAELGSTRMLEISRLSRAPDLARVEVSRAATAAMCHHKPLQYINCKMK